LRVTAKRTPTRTHYLAHRTARCLKELMPPYGSQCRVSSRR